jgi:hypothetical protein
MQVRGSHDHPGAAWSSLQGTDIVRHGKSPKGVSELLIRQSQWRPKFVVVDEQSNHQIVHPFGLGETDRPTHQPLDPRPQVDRLALDFLCLVLAHTMLLGIKMTLVSAPAIRVIFRDPKRLQQRLELQKHFILAAPKDIRQHLTA